MGIPIFLMGESGTGKTTSLRNFSEDEVVIINVGNKVLPFRKKLKTIKMIKGESPYDRILKTFKAGLKKGIKVFVIDDSQFLIAFEVINKAHEKGYEKWSVLAGNFVNMLRFIADCLPDDVRVYLLHHTELKSDEKIKLKTAGKMLDNVITLESLSTIVLMTEIDEQGCFKIITKNKGNSTVKTPEEMFDGDISNDLKYVDDVIKKFYQLP